MSERSHALRLPVQPPIAPMLAEIAHALPEGDGWLYEPKWEVAFDHLQGERFRHGAIFRRWRYDKPPRDCTFAQVEEVVPSELRAIFGG